MLRIDSLGKFEVSLDGSSFVEGVEPRRGLLLTYLAENQGPQLRSEIAQLLWPNTEERLALNSLRVLLSRMRRQATTPFLDADRTTVSIGADAEVSYDVDQIRAVGRRVHEVDEATLRQAADLYEGSFLATCSLDEFPALDEWAAAIRAEVEMLMVRILYKLSKLLLESRSDSEAAVRYAQHLVELAPEDDEIQGIYLEALTANGQLAIALQQFALYRRNLPEDRSVGKELTQLMARLSRAENAARLVDSVQLSMIGSNEDIAPTISKNGVSDTEPEEKNEVPLFPHVEHAMVGRGIESSAFEALLDSSSRLITIVGLGGTGKTFFVRSQFNTLKKGFGSEIYFVDLRGGEADPTEAESILWQSIATAFEMRIDSHRSLHEQVISLLRNGKRCLILDNFESIQPAAALLLELVQAAPQLTIVVTSRQTLNLGSENILKLGGLKFEFDEGSTIADSDAIQYFIQCVRQYQTFYEIGEEDLPLIEAICRKVEGLPLAIELAARQLDFFTLSELAERIALDRAVLTDDKMNLPGDQYSVWAILDSMWETLSSEEQNTLSELSVFSGVWHRDAMLSVAPARRNVYTVLNNTSLLRVEQPAWFSLHPLVKQYAAEHLHHGSEVHKRHAYYFLGLLETHEQLRNVTGLYSILPKLRRSQADVFRAWQWSVKHRQWELLHRAIVAFGQFLDMTLQREEGIDLFSKIFESLPGADDYSPLQRHLAGRASFYLGSFYVYQPGDPGQIWRQKAITLLEDAGSIEDLAAAYVLHADLLSLIGTQWEDAIEPTDKAAELLKKHNYDALRVSVAASRGNLLTLQGKWAELTQLNREIDPHLEGITNIAVWTGVLLQSGYLGDWQQIERRLQIIDRAYSDHDPRRPVIELWKEHFRSYPYLAQGDLESAISIRRRILCSYRGLLDNNEPQGYSELAIWNAYLGNEEEANMLAEKGLQFARREGDQLISSFSVMCVGFTYLLLGKREEALRLCIEALFRGLIMHINVTLFSALFCMAILFQRNESRFLSADTPRLLLSPLY
ncbi:MAG: BTAD domain-containing putative transcriptional regulator [Caldilineaceae bacterium]